MKTVKDLLASTSKKIQSIAESYLTSEDARFGYTETDEGFEVNGFVDRGTKRGINIEIKADEVTYLTCTCGKASTNKLCAHAHAILQLVHDGLLVNPFEVDDDFEAFENDMDFFEDEDYEVENPFSEAELKQVIDSADVSNLRMMVFHYATVDPSFASFLATTLGGTLEASKRSQRNFAPVAKEALRLSKLANDPSVLSIDGGLENYAIPFLEILEVVDSIDDAEDYAPMHDAVDNAWKAHTLLPKVIEDKLLAYEIRILDKLSSSLVRAYQALIIHREFGVESIWHPKLKSEYKAYTKTMQADPAKEIVLHPTDYLRILGMGEPDNEMIDFVEAEFGMWLPKLDAESERVQRIHEDRMNYLFFANRYPACFAAAELLKDRAAAKKELKSLFALSETPEVLEAFLKEGGW